MIDLIKHTLYNAINLKTFTDTVIKLIVITVTLVYTCVSDDRINFDFGVGAGSFEK